jgi:hypothetical protein
LSDLRHPAILRIVQAFICFVRALLALKFNPVDIHEVLNEITELGSTWTRSMNFIRSREIEPNDQADVYMLGSIALAAKLMNEASQLSPPSSRRLSRGSRMR